MAVSTKWIQNGEIEDDQYIFKNFLEVQVYDRKRSTVIWMGEGIDKEKIVGVIFIKQDIEHAFYPKGWESEQAK